MLSLRDPVWAHNRVPVLTIFMFVVLTLVATLVHINKMHFDDDFGGLTCWPRARPGSGWPSTSSCPWRCSWRCSEQERAPGDDPAPEHPVPLPLRVALGLESAVLLVVGLMLFIDPTTAPRVWPWELTPFTGRVIAAWLIAFGLATALAAVAGDLERLRTAAIAYTTFGVLVLVTVARFTEQLRLGRPAHLDVPRRDRRDDGDGAVGWRLAPTSGRRHRG